MLLSQQELYFIGNARLPLQVTLLSINLITSDHHNFQSNNYQITRIINIFMLILHSKKLLFSVKYLNKIYRDIEQIMHRNF